MKQRYEIPVLLAIFVLVATADSQSSAAGYGQKSASGYGQGGGGLRSSGFHGANPISAAEESNLFLGKPEDERVENLWVSKSAVLTPGDHVDYKLKLRAGETMLAGAVSEAFDPALAVVDPAGQIVFNNDDREEGDQSPFVAYRVPKEGDYTLRVLSYHSVAGGQFALKYRTLLAIDAGFGMVAAERPPITEDDRADRVGFRIQGVKGHIYDLRSVIEQAGENQFQYGFLRMIGPTGVDLNDFAMVPAPGGGEVFRALRDGDFYAEYMSNGNRRFHTDFHEVQVIQAKDTDTLDLELNPHELEVVLFPVKPDQIIRTTVKAPAYTYVVTSPKGGESPGGGDGSYGNSGGQTWFLPNVDHTEDYIRIFHVKGDAVAAIRSNKSDGKEAVSFKNTESLPEWSDGVPIKDRLGIGDTRLFLLYSTKSELMRVYAASQEFQTRLDIFRLDGERANSLCDRSTHMAGDDLYFPDPGVFVVRLTCDGFGGSGEYVMHREALKPRPYKLGITTEMKLDGTNFGLYSVNLEKGKRYELITDRPDLYLTADLLDQDGQFLRSNAIGFEKVVVQYFVPTRSGVHRLWLRGAPGTRQFKFSVNIPPSIG